MSKLDKITLFVVTVFLIVTWFIPTILNNTITDCLACNCFYIVPIIGTIWYLFLLFTLYFLNKSK